MNVKEEFLRLGHFRLGNGTQVFFWEDKWVGDIRIKDLFPGLYNIVRKKGDCGYRLEK
jgi:hypothetical protein